MRRIGIGLFRNIVAILALSVEPSSASSKDAPPFARVGSHALRIQVVRQRVTSAYAPATPVPCSRSAARQSFVAIPGARDVAGGTYAAVVAGTQNEACDADSAVAGGKPNAVGYYGFATNSFIGGGERNDVISTNSFVGAGIGNVAASDDTFVGTGRGNLAEGVDTFVGGGAGNSALGDGNFIGSGSGNHSDADSTFIGSGEGNQIPETGDFSFVGGGYRNYVRARASFVGAGLLGRITGNGSFIGAGDWTYASYGAKHPAIPSQARILLSARAIEMASAPTTRSSANALYDGSFVWSDYRSGSIPLKDNAPNEFVARASGGVYFYTNESATSGVVLPPGSGAWGSVSDRNAKTDAAPLDDSSILDRVAKLPIDTWRYKSEIGARRRADGSRLLQCLWSRRRRPSHLIDRRRRHRTRCD